MTTRYRVVVAGMGKRGMHHAAAFAASSRFELVGIASRDQQRLTAAAGKLGDIRASTDVQALATELKPDIFCFCTPPAVRLPLIEVGIQSGAKLIAFEKPVAMTSADYVVFTDHDCVPQPDFLSRHAKLAERGWFVAGNRVLMGEALTRRVLAERLPIHTWSAGRWAICRAMVTARRSSRLSPSERSWNSATAQLNSSQSMEAEQEPIDRNSRSRCDQCIGP